MEYQTIVLEAYEGIVEITLNRPEVNNALNAAMRAELRHAIQNAGSAARVLVLTGAGDAFCAGQDLGAGERVADVDVERILRDEYMPILRSLEDCPVPVIAAVNGLAAGPGANLALAADLVVAAERASFRQTQTQIGLIPDSGGSYWLPRQMGFARAMGAALLAEPISARRAEAWGMIWEAVQDDAFEAVWRARAARLAQGPTKAFAAIRRAFREGLHNDYGTQMSLEARLQGQCSQTRDFAEGVLAYMEKRPPHFEGR
ncbi:MAG: enoyl-CoA hydratase-related protein [Pseudomonadota bacterium]